MYCDSAEDPNIPIECFQNDGLRVESETGDALYAFGGRFDTANSGKVTFVLDGVDILFADFPLDPGCMDATDVIEDPQCQDGINNDPGQDPDPGLIDFDGGLSALGYVVSAPDPQCVGTPWRNKEKSGNCGLGFELALILPGLMRRHRRRRGKPYKQHVDVRQGSM